MLRSYRHMHNRICQIYRLFIYGECSWVQSMLWFFPNSELMLWVLMSTDVFWPIWAWVYQNKTLVSSLCGGQFVLKSTHFLPIWINISMTTLLTHTVAHFTRPSFRLKTNNQPLKFFLSVAVSWVKLGKNGKILTFKVNFLCQKLSKSF